ncbi:hypothetical protein CNQ84_05835 [Pseudomonas abyssi]|uniref:UvrABC system protein A n=1 Tax=Pseudomonas abyssi TaxID=170540 RepID=A0A2A3MKE8_9PSED|nr:ATP-binding cassette domain-containing protein [Pseudomonas abyssi]MAC98884.1 hypothetical protein [Pseudomonadales bacterium]PBK05299.1 hypothetical protein CNQ84_05835 [Pseudomonas abyssi]|tara:strand:+ start:44546 stop:45268 length:723 start_codon:yes stop_codon:yes gene_type:complete
MMQPGLGDIRRVFARQSGKPAGLFSNNAAGACPTCKGRGVVRTDLAFLDTVESVCEVCGGSSYNAEARAVRVKGYPIDQVMRMRAPDVRRLFDGNPEIRETMARMEQVGLGYLQIGQRLSTLSGGERQRLKLAKELGLSGQIYVFDEPTSGLPTQDIERLIQLLGTLVEQGITLIIVEHNLDMIAAADHVIEMGPGAGKYGGHIIYQGGPAGLQTEPKSVIGPFLCAYLKSQPSHSVCLA